MHAEPNVFVALKVFHILQITFTNVDIFMWKVGKNTTHVFSPPRPQIKRVQEAIALGFFFYQTG